MYVKLLTITLQRLYTNNGNIMLGIKTRRAPIEGDIAEKIRDAVARVASGQLNEHEKENARRSRDLLNKNKINWVGL